MLFFFTRFLKLYCYRTSFVFPFYNRISFFNSLLYRVLYDSFYLNDILEPFNFDDFFNLTTFENCLLKSTFSISFYVNSDYRILSNIITYNCQLNYYYYAINCYWLNNRGCSNIDKCFLSLEESCQGTSYLLDNEDVVFWQKYIL
nr:hypothetical protein [Porphyropsis coccinea]